MIQIKRILQIVPTLGVAAGMTSVVINYHRHINRDLIQFDYLYFDETNSMDYKEEILSLGGRVFYINRRCSYIQIIKQFNSFLSEHKGEFEAMHCHPIFTWVIFSNIARKYGIKHIIAHSHSTQFSEKKISSIRNRLLIKMLPYTATKFIACTKEAKCLFGKRINKTKSIIILNNAIECSRFGFNQTTRDRMRFKLGLNNEFIMGHVGRFSIEKNHMFIIDIFKQLKKMEPDSKLILIGDGPLMKTVKERIISENIEDDVILTGRRDDIPELLMAMDCFVLPSYFEGSPVSIIEAQTTGLPCYITNTITRSVGFFNCTYLSLDRPAYSWAETIVNNKCKKERTDGVILATDNNFNIASEAEELCDFYLNLNN